MKNVMVANRQRQGRYSKKWLDKNLKAQVENSIECGWEPKDILIIANFRFKFMGVTALKTDLNTTCLTGSKMFGIKWLFEHNLVDGIMWLHDLDAWQNVWFDPPEIKDVGITTYSRPTFNGGSVFWTPASREIVEAIVCELENDQQKEEPTINRILKSEEFSDRVTVLNQTFNVGCSGFVKRAKAADKPIRVAHFHPMNKIAWDTHALNRNKEGITSICPRLEKLLRRYYSNLETRPGVIKPRHKEAS